MKWRVIFHPLTKWGPIGRAKIRKKLGCSRVAPLRPFEGAVGSRELGLGLGTLIPSHGAFMPSESRIARFFRHEFKVLGVEWNELPGSHCAKKIEGQYTSIDWKPDFGKKIGEDIKLPWELSRFHGFTEMAYYAHGKDAATVARVYGEILHQLHDFSGSNPVGVGVHWGCAMDVSIRAVNIIVALELLHSAGVRPSTEEMKFLATLLRSHGAYVFQNLEWYRVGRGNHYLADLIGIMACSLWLEDDHETRSWFAFATNELEIEAGRQFLKDGSNFEGSVFYHRLSLELLTLGYVFLKGPARRKRGWSGELQPLARKLWDGLKFLEDMTDCQGRGVQFGDHDSGRALKIQVPEIQIDGRLIEDSLDTRDALSIKSLFQGEEITGALGEVCLWIAGKKSSIPNGLENFAANQRIVAKEVEPPSEAIVHEFQIPLFSVSEVKFGQYADFGVFYWKCSGTEIWMRCGSPSKDGHGGHAHFDQLHLELRVDGVPVTFDPGSFTYTANLPMRNLYRGPESHFIPRLPEQEGMARNNEDAFRYPGLPVGECLAASEAGFCGRYKMQDQTAFRKFSLVPGMLKIWDWSENGPLLSQVPAFKKVSWGYGEQVHWPLRFARKEKS